MRFRRRHVECCAHSRSGLHGAQFLTVVCDSFAFFATQKRFSGVFPSDMAAVHPDIHATLTKRKAGNILEAIQALPEDLNRDDCLSCWRQCLSARFGSGREVDVQDALQQIEQQFPLHTDLLDKLDNVCGSESFTPHFCEYVYAEFRAVIDVLRRPGEVGD
jgi:hypothetical protein